MIFFQLFSLETDPDDLAKKTSAVYEELLEKIGNDDIQALEALYHATDRAVFGFALSIVKNRQDAEDVMHDTYLKIRAAAHLYQKRGRPMAWILTITKNLALMHLRVSNRLADAPPEESRLAIEDNTERSVDRLVLRGALERLQEDERQVVMLHATGVRNREIAEIMGLPLGTVLSKRARALKKLRSYLQHKGGGEK